MIPSETGRAVPEASAESASHGPQAGDVIFEIGAVLAFHLAFAAAVLLALSAG